MNNNINDIDLAMAVDMRTKDAKVLDASKAINQRLEILLLTRYGEMPMEPLVGSDIATSLFHSGHVAADIVKDVVAQLVDDWEHRIELVNVEVSESEQHAINVAISYKIIGDVSDSVYDVEIVVQ